MPARGGSASAPQAASAEGRSVEQAPQAPFGPKGRRQDGGDGSSRRDAAFGPPARQAEARSVAAGGVGADPPTWAACYPNTLGFGVAGGQ